jgi:ABC-type molybdenum transport system ATPase subunit/photorepair protein PhrA/GNAT superfamily N-acetyltransferase
MHITVECPIEETPRVLQVRGIFDLPAAATSALSWEVELPLHEKPWHIGLIVGPSGCGKSTIARSLWPEALARSPTWHATRSVLDGFPKEVPIKELIELLSSVGFSSPPAWLRPFHVLSTGQQFRVTLAWLLAATAPGRLIVLDEYTSVVDRTVAQVGSAALAKTVRKRGQQFIAVTCHEDVEDWLQPDWVYRPAERRFQWRSLQRRPSIELSVFRCRHEAWVAFAPHHYLSHSLARGAVCFLATWQRRPVAFSAWLPKVGTGPPGRREHRTVTLPDYQGVGIGHTLSTTIAAMWKARGCEATSTTTHPALIAARCRSPHWRMHRRPSLCGSVETKYRGLRHARTRLTAGFTYCGPALTRAEAEALHG